MKLALISDIHGNRHALEAVWARLLREEPDKIICGGDIVGYGAFPAECVQWVREHCDITVRGNHDHHVVQISGAHNFNPRAYAALAWTAENIPGDDLDWLASMPMTAEMDDIRVTHGHPMLPEAWLYILDRHQADMALKSVQEKVVITGHSHVQACFLESEAPARLVHFREIELGARRSVLNPGSVGQPRDGDPRAAFALLDTERWTFTPMRVGYDVEGARDAILEAGLPAELGDRLLAGY
ncbi:metallophosphoesterase family protein [Gemmatimonadota bacterium]